ncbi:alpha/beta hydrolase [Piscinibacter sp. XHJ-5]|uniref:alpha/beta hydrolase n=1 Tax=Piscinibacter sp. XHJ-5 TaxID=3037797 RepID=UPI0024535C14|nr:alpha/beta hydrolase [Piscinibacter sp. XHJ-5]
MKETLLWAVVAVLVFLAAVFLWQDRLLYFPMRTTVDRMTGASLRAWPSSHEFRGLVAEPAGQARGTAIVFHGNAGHAGHRDFYAQSLVPLGLRVILAEYPGYGPRAGAPGEASLVSDAEETVAKAHAQYGAPLLLIGESLGAAVAAAAGAKHRDRIGGLLLITPWDRLPHVGAHHYPWLPVKWMLRDEYDSVARLAELDRPVVVAVAERDSIVPAKYGIALHQALRGPKRLLVIEGSDHNDWAGRVDVPWWRDVLGTFGLS